jgi:hypothetical protein
MPLSRIDKYECRIKYSLVDQRRHSREGGNPSFIAVSDSVYVSNVKIDLLQSVFPFALFGQDDFNDVAHAAFAAIESRNVGDAISQIIRPVERHT